MVIGDIVGGFLGDCGGGIRGEKLGYWDSEVVLVGFWHGHGGGGSLGWLGA